MNTDTDALAAYAEAWKPGDPLPAGMEVDQAEFDGETKTWIRYGGCYRCVAEWVKDGRSKWDNRMLAQMSEALTGVLVVELAKKECRLVFGFVRQYWYVLRDHRDEQVSEGPTPLCALVAAWLEVNK